MKICRNSQVKQNGVELGILFMNGNPPAVCQGSTQAGSAGQKKSSPNSSVREQTEKSKPSTTFLRLRDEQTIRAS